MKELVDRIIVINLPGRTDRLKHTREELQRIGIKDFEVYPAIEGKPGAKGLLDSLFCIYREVAAGADQNVLIIEDDVKFLVNKAVFQTTVRKSMEQLQQIGYFDLLYLGVNAHQRFEKFEAENLLKLRNGYATHAIIYSRASIKKILQNISPVWDRTPIDVMLSGYIQSDGNSYCTYPMLATQRKGFSDIELKNIDYSFIQERFAKHVKHLIKNKM